MTFPQLSVVASLASLAVASSSISVESRSAYTFPLATVPSSVLSSVPLVTRTELLPPLSPVKDLVPSPPAALLMVSLETLVVVDSPPLSLLFQELHLVSCSAHSNQLLQFLPLVRTSGFELMKLDMEGLNEFLEYWTLNI
ncbi:hypothetical protein PIB30_079218 [Stylosanthes scabra]|uniref:Secreted protein n=1 Tax=Stylosanthes scabra TaxID=79078 RepID=A0ABU6YQ09_9FABA|nr:hypothetical protein [Stylosanthes scabra]